MIGAIVTATREHAFNMAPRMCAVEVLEILDSDGLVPEMALLRELDRSVSAWSWVIGDEVACMFGIVAPNMLDDQAYPWFLTTPLVETHARQFARSCKALLPELLARHPRLVGMVDARHDLSVRWLQWLGARLEDPRPWGVAGAPFHKFEIGG